MVGVSGLSFGMGLLTGDPPTCSDFLCFPDSTFSVCLYCGMWEGLERIPLPDPSHSHPIFTLAS